MNQLYPFRVVGSFGIAILACTKIYELVYSIFFPKELTVFTSTQDNDMPCPYHINRNSIQEFYFTQRAQRILMQRSAKLYRNQSLCENSVTNTFSIFK